MRVLQSLKTSSQTLTSPDWKYVQRADIIPGYIQNRAGRLQPDAVIDWELPQISCSSCMIG